MPGTISYAYRNLMLDHGIGGVAFTPPPTLYVALYTTPPGPGDLGTEVVDALGFYVRQSQPNDLTQWSAAVNGVKNNLTTIAWPAQQSALGLIVSVGWRDDPTTGMLLWSCDLVQPVQMIVGATLIFPAGSFTINWA